MLIAKPNNTARGLLLSLGSAPDLCGSMRGLIMDFTDLDMSMVTYIWRT